MEQVQGVRRLHPVDIEVDEVWVSESATEVPVGYYRIAAGETAELDDCGWIRPPS
ncbi:MAG: hypothetical protein M3406_06390 [Chloroflexota bacterium]|nr:hypothetical protein [Chloroflexota bacterium]